MNCKDCGRFWEECECDEKSTAVVSPVEPIVRCQDCGGQGFILQDDGSDSIGTHTECGSCNSDHKLVHVCDDCNWPCNCEDSPCSCPCGDDELRG